MGRYLTYFMQKTGAVAMSWYERVIAMIVAAVERSPVAGGSSAARLDNLVAWVILGGGTLSQMSAESWDNVKQTVTGAFPGYVKHLIEEKTGIAPITLDEAGIKAWADAVICKLITDRLGVEVLTLATPQGVTAMLNSMTNEVLLELKADETAKYTLLSFDQSAALRKQIAANYLRANPSTVRGIFMMGAATVLPVDRADMLNTLRQQRYRKKHKLYYENWFVDPTTDALLVQMRNDLDKVI